MLNLETLKERVRGGGFRPFTLHLSDGRHLPVGHPELIPIACYVVVVAAEDDVTYPVDPLHVAAISEATAVPTTVESTQCPDALQPAVMQQ